MVEAIANLVRAFPAERARDGQPYVGVELLPRAPGPSRREASGRSACAASRARRSRSTPRSTPPTPTCASATCSAQPRSRDPAGSACPAACCASASSAASSTRSLAAERRARLAAAGADRARPGRARRARRSCASSSRPRPTWFEALARGLYRRHENRLVRAERWGLREGGLTSTLNRAEMRNAEQTQNRSLFWLELVVAADTPRRRASTLAAAVQARRGENRLHRRWMIVRREPLPPPLPARPSPPLLPSPRALVSAAEVAHLLELPSARMKGVPVRRATVPRIPEPPEALRADDLDPIAAPPRPREPRRREHDADRRAAA